MKGLHARLLGLFALVVAISLVLVLFPRTGQMESSGSFNGIKLNMDGGSGAIPKTGPLIVTLGSFTDISPTIALPQPVANAAVVADGGNLFVIGGVAGPSLPPVNTIYKANFGTGGPPSPLLGWTTLTNSLPAGRARAAAIFFFGRIYVLGGEAAADASPVDTIYFSSMPAGTSIPGPWTTAAATLPQPLKNHQAVTYKGYVYILGGKDSSSNASSKVYYARLNLDGTIGNWLSAPDLPRPLESLGAVAYDDRIVLGGGRDGSGVYADTYYAQVQLDGSLGPWTAAPAMSLPRPTYAHSLIAAGNMLVVAGGAAVPSGDPLVANAIRTTAVYTTGIRADWSTTGWDAAGPLPYAVDEHAGGFSSGRIIIAGGRTDAGIVNNVTYGFTPRNTALRAYFGSYLANAQNMGPNAQLSQWNLIADDGIQYQYRTTGDGVNWGPWSPYTTSKSIAFSPALPLKNFQWYARFSSDGTVTQTITSSAYITTTVAPPPPTGDITGAVSSPGIGPISSASVNLRTSNGSFSRSTITDLGGWYGFGPTGTIPTGNYLMRAYAPYSGPNSWLADSLPVQVVYTSGTALRQDLTLVAPVVSGTVILPGGQVVTGTNVKLAYWMTSPSPAHWMDIEGFPTNVNGVFRIPPLGANQYRLIANPPNRPGFENYADSLPVDFTYSSGNLYAGNITLTIAAITGTVQDPNGNPVANTSVKALSSPTGPTIASANTDSNGNFKLGGLTPGTTYYLVAYKPFSSPYYDSNPLAILYTGGTNSLAAPLRLNASPSYDIGGYVRDLLGGPVASSDVSLWNDSHSADRGSRTDGSGAYGLTNVVSGTYSMQAKAPFTGPGSNLVDSETRTVTFTAGITQRIDFVLATPAVTATIILPGGQAITNSGATLFRWTPDGGGMGWYQWLSFYGTNGNGVVRIPSLSPGQYRLMAEAPDGPGFENWADSDPIDFAYDGSPVFAGVLTLNRLSISGRLVGPDGVTGMSIGSIDLLDENGNRINGTGVDQSGNFRFGGLAAGNYKLVGRADNVSPYFDSDIVSLPYYDGANALTNQQVRLRPVDISGSVVLPNGSPAADSHIDIRTSPSGSPVANSHTGSDGTFRTGGLISGTTYYLVAFPPQNSAYVESEPLAVTFVGNPIFLPQPLRLRTETPPDIRGLVSDPDGNLVALASVSLWDSSHNVGRWTSTDNQGAYALRNLPTGDYFMQAYAPSEGPGAQFGDSAVAPISFTFGISQRVDFVLSRPAVTATVALPGGQVVTDTNVSLYRLMENGDGPANWNNVGGYRTNNNGVVRISSLDFGTYRLMAWVPNRPGFEAYADSNYIEFTYGGGTQYAGLMTLNMVSIRGTVTAPDGVSPEAGAWVELLDAGGNAIRATNADSAGGFKFGGLAAGVFQARANPAPQSSYFNSGLVSLPHYDGVNSLSGLIVRLKPVDIYVAVVNPDGSPASGVNVGVRTSPFGNYLSSGSSCSIGNCRIGDLTDGVTYYLVAQPSPSSPYFESLPMEVVFPGYTITPSEPLRLRNPNYTGVVVDPYDNPVQDVRVELRNRQHDQFPAGQKNTDSEGRFGFALTEGVLYALEVYPPSSSPYAAPEPYTWVFTGTGSVVLRLVEPMISGVVRDPSGLPVSYAGVNLDTFNARYNAAVGSDGTFKFGDIRPNTYRIRAFVWPQSPYSDSPAYTVIYDGTPISGLIITVSMPIITGTVTAPDRVTPIANAGVRLYSLDHSIEIGSGTGNDGKFKLGGFSDGVYFVEASPGFGSESPYAQSRPVAITVTNGVPVNVTPPLIVPLSIASITGTVFAPNGTTPVVRSHVMLRNASYSVQLHGDSNESGNFKFGGIAAGTYILEAEPSQGSGYSRALPKTVVVENGLTNYYSITLTMPNLTGIAIRESGGITIPVGRAGVDVRLQGNPAIGSSSGTDDGGRFAIGGLAPGVYLMSVHTPWDSSGLMAPPPKLVTITESGPVFETVVFANAVKHITGRVSRANGEPVTDAMVFANKENGGGWANGRVDDQGRFRVDVGPGVWMVGVGAERHDQIPDWIFGKEQRRVVFFDTPDDETTELLLEVMDAGSLIRGELYTPDGLPASFANVNFRTSGGIGNGGPIRPDGSFAVPLPAGTYQFNVWLQDQTLTAPRLDPLVLGSDDVVNLGRLVLRQKTSRIVGAVTDASGTGAPGLRVGAWMRSNSPGEGPNEWSQTTTITDGVFVLYVVAGPWEVSVQPDPTSRYVQGGQPARVEVGDGQTVRDVNLSVLAADAELSGSIVDQDGNPLTDLFGWANARSGFGPGSVGYGGPINGGRFTIRLPSGTYAVEGGLPSGATYNILRREGVEVSGSTVISLVAAPANSWIAGGLVGAVTSGLRANVGAGGPLGHTNTQVDPATGQFAMRVAAGDWFVNGWLDPASGYVIEPPMDNHIATSNGLTATFNLTVVQANAKVWGLITNPDGAPLGGVWVGASQKGEPGRPRPPYGTETNARGYFTITLPPGTYDVGASLPPERGFLPPRNQETTVTEDNLVVRVDLSFRESDATIAGQVTLSGVPVTRGMVRGWSSSGAHAYTTVQNDGSYVLPVVSGDTWHIEAVSEEGSMMRRSPAYDVAVSGSIAHQDLALSDSFTSMPPSRSETFDASAAQLFVLDDGTRIDIPAGALAISGTVTVRAVPRGTVALDSAARPIGLAYDLSAIDSTGATINTFRRDVAVILQYTDEQLAALGITEDQVMGSYWDAATGSWRTVTNVVQDRSANNVTIYSNHFSQWSITGKVVASEGTPPSTASIAGSVQLQARGSAPSARWTVPVTVTLHDPGVTTPSHTYNATTDTSGRFTIPSVVTGTFDVKIKKAHGLTNKLASVELVDGANVLDFGTILEGDVNDDGVVNSLDYARLATSYLKSTGLSGFDPGADFNGDGRINASDYAVLATNYMRRDGDGPLRVLRAVSVR